MNRLNELPAQVRRLAIATLATATAAGAAQAQETAAGPTRQLEEIVVTAQKREQTLMEIPQSITVIDGELLRRQQADNFQDYLSLVPGLSLESSTQGVTRITLRGVNTGGVASTVGVYVDEVPFGSSSGLANAAILAGDFDTFDVARLEVLRGPQGTLYGASSLGGVIRFVTNAPDPRAFEFRAEAGVEDVESGDLGTMPAFCLYCFLIFRPNQRPCLPFHPIFGYFRGTHPCQQTLSRSWAGRMSANQPCLTGFWGCGRPLYTTSRA